MEIGEDVRSGVSYVTDSPENIVSKDIEPYNVLAFRKIVNDMSETYKKKNADYGNAYEVGFAKFGSVQLLSRIYEKFERLYNILYLNKDAHVSDESVCDTLTDMAVQCIVLRMLLKEENVEPAVLRMYNDAEYSPPRFARGCN